MPEEGGGGGGGGGGREAPVAPSGPAPDVCHNTYITFDVYCKYLEQVRSEKRAIDTFDVYYKLYKLIYKENQHFLYYLLKLIYYNKMKQKYSESPRY